jgi:hypothetical protein
MMLLEVFDAFPDVAVARLRSPAAHPARSDPTAFVSQDDLDEFVRTALAGDIDDIAPAPIRNTELACAADPTIRMIVDAIALDDSRVSGTKDVSLSKDFDIVRRLPPPGHGSSPASFSA